MLEPKKNPCAECPFRRIALPGYLGNSTPESFLAAAHCGEVPMPCHSEVNYDAKDWEEELPFVHQCTGHARYLGNTCKRPRNEEVRVLPADHGKFFSNQFDFLKHHGGDIVRFTSALLNTKIDKEYAKTLRKTMKLMAAK